MNISAFILPFLLLSLISSTVKSADDYLLANELPIVISASRLNQTVLTSPSSVTVIDKSMISASGFIEFADILRLVPGFQVAHADGRRFAVAYHGPGSDIGNRLQVLVNGRSTFTPSLSTVDWDQLGIQLEDVDHIEIVRGSSASAYGSNSFTAAINIITKLPALDDTLNLKYRRGNKGEEKKVLRYSDSVGDATYRITLAQRDNDGLDDFRDSRNFDYISIHSEFNKESNHPIDLYLSYNDGLTGTEISSSFLEERNRKAKSWSAHLKGQNVISPTKDIKWSIYHNSDKTNDLARSILISEILEIPPAVFTAFTGSPDQTIIDGDETNDTTKTDFEVTLNGITNNGLKYMAGSGINYDSLRSKSYFNEDGKATGTTYRVFANAQTEITDIITLNTGAIYEHVRHYQGKTSPRASINFKTGTTQSIRFSASRGYRFPSLLESNFNKNIFLDNGFLLDTVYLSDDNIQTEKIDSVDIGYLGKLRSLPIKWDLKLYQDKIENMIGFPLDRSANDVVGNYYRLISNSGDHKAYGLEGEISYHPNQDFIRFHFNIGKAISRFDTQTNPTRTREEEFSAADESYGLLGSKKINDWRVNLGIYHISKISWLNTGDPIERHTRVDVGITKRFKVNNKHIDFKIAGQNIGGKHKEYDNRRFFEPRFYASISYTLP